MAEAIARRQREREALEAEEARLGINASGAPSYVQRRGGGLVGGLWEGVLQGDTALRSAANTLAMEKANHLAAGLKALVPVHGQGMRERYVADLAAENARDDYDAVRRPLAQQIGAGGALALALYGGRGLPASKRLIGSALRSARETAAILGAGGISGLALQNLSDVAAHRPGDWRDGVGAMAGGVAGAAALGLGTGRAGAIGSATTTAVQNALRGRPASLDDLGRSASAGRVIGALAGAGGSKLSASLSPQTKGRLGENLGTVRSAINHMEREPGPKKLFKPEGAKAGTVPDGRSIDKLFEDKFGPKAALRTGQRIAKSLLGPNYIIYHWLPEDVGKIIAAPLTSLGSQWMNRRPAGGDKTPPRRR